MAALVRSLSCPVCGLALPEPLPGHCPRPSCGVGFLPEPPLRLQTFRLVNHYSLFVLPFSFPEGDGADPRARLAESGRWRPRVFSASEPADIDRTEYFLPYIRRFLFPHGNAASCRRFLFDLSVLGADAKGGLALTLRGRDARQNRALEHRLRLEEVELIVFGYRVGFLILRVVNDDPTATYFDQMEVVSHLRIVTPLYRDFELPELEGPAGRHDLPQLLAYLLAEFAPGPVLPASPEALPAAATLPVKPAYEDRMMVYTFSCLDKGTCLEDAERCQTLLHKASVIGFDEAWSRLPPRERRQREPTAWLRTRWQGFTKDGGALVVFDTDRYHERYVGTYHGTYYFDVFLLAALQRVTLLALFERLADIPALTTGGSAGRRQLRRVRRELLLFKNQCWFSQITNRERGLVLWKKWQKTLETRALFREVSEQSAELDAYLQGRHRERTERLVKVGGFLAAAVPAVMGLDAFFDRAEWARSLRWVLLALLLLGSAVAAWYVSFRQDDV